MAKFYLYLLLAFAVLFSCTNPFSTRAIENPGTSQKSDIFDSPTSPDKVFSNLEYALEQNNVVNYMSCFSDTSVNAPFAFTFVPDPTIQWNEFLNWQLEDERNYLNKLIQNKFRISFEFIDDPKPQSLDNSIDLAETIYFRYELRTAGDEERVFRGKARMKLVKSDLSLWSVYFWEDLRDDPENPDTWSMLKSLYRN